MSTAALTLPAGGRPRMGPALRRAPFPLAVTVLSALMHGGLAAAVLTAAAAWSASQPKTYIVNLVPTVAAAGTPRPQPEVVSSARREPPSPPPDLPARDAPPAALPEMPTRPRPADALGLPERTQPLRPPGLPRPAEKELPALASVPIPRSAPAPRPTPVPEPARVEPAPPPPPPIGRPSGSAQGSGVVTLNVTDFPFAWYLSVIQRKITERWAGKALEGHQPVALFEIHRDGRIGGLTIEKTSGNPFYDRAALRAITEATPFPPLPEAFPAPVLRVHLGFNFAPDRE